MADLREVREWYAEEIRYAAAIEQEGIVTAFATVPRESFLGLGPWAIHHVDGRYWQTPNDDPKHVYHNVVVAIDSTRRLNNGQPSWLASAIQTLVVREKDRVAHIGCGTGYYSAILAKIVGQEGHVIAVEVDGALAEHARTNVACFPNIQIVNANGTDCEIGPCDAVLVNAGVSRLSLAWLEALKPGGRLLVPLTMSDDANGTIGEGRSLKVTRAPEGYTAAFVNNVGIYHCIGGRDEKSLQQLRAAVQRAGWEPVASLRLDKHIREEECWLHAEDYCLSTRPLV